MGKNGTHYVPEPGKQSNKAAWWIGGIIALFIVGSVLPETEEECERAYREDYVFYGDPSAMSMEDYCENFNDTSWLDEDAYNIGETYD